MSQPSLFIHFLVNISDLFQNPVRVSHSAVAHLPVQHAVRRGQKILQRWFCVQGRVLTIWGVIYIIIEKMIHSKHPVVNADNIIVATRRSEESKNLGSCVLIKCAPPGRG